ncbi:unnamed protein product [Blepharisma stoltei]|uniref:DUF5658 domain-containing protein n=1 Tax=Blepharisma stoltei TaxID=1481888 RepID=A0AAU9J8M6_9CILI|nr:unnamed protein product [Blepharisma stoltei]
MAILFLIQLVFVVMDTSQATRLASNAHLHALNALTLLQHALDVKVAYCWAAALVLTVHRHALNVKQVLPIAPSAILGIICLATVAFNAHLLV